MSAADDQCRQEKSTNRTDRDYAHTHTGYLGGATTLLLYYGTRKWLSYDLRVRRGPVLLK